MSLETPLYGKVIFLFFRISYEIQRALAKLFWYVAIKPGLLLGKSMGIKRDKVFGHSEPYFILDTLLKSHRSLWSYLSTVFKIHSWISGTRHRYSMYEHLINWNASIPLIGFEEDKGQFLVELLLGESQYGGRSVDFVSLSTHKIIGKFKVIGKEINPQKANLEIKALWLTGSERGKAFSVNENFPFNNGTVQSKPSLIYQPPKLVIVTVEIILSASALLVLMQLAREGWRVFSNFFVSQP